MNQKVAKRIRKQIYGKDYSIRHREYITDEKTKTITAIGTRRLYQDAKKIYKQKRNAGA